MQKTPALLSLGALLIALTPLRGQEKPKDILAEQKKTATANWEMLKLGEVAHNETAHLLIYAPKNQEGRIKKIGQFLERHYLLAAKVLFTEKDDGWKGKLAVYLFSEPTDFGSFVRRIEKRRLEGRETGTMSIEEERLHVAACPPRSDDEPSVEIQAGLQVAQAVIQHKAKRRTILPAWLKQGFGWATHYRALGTQHSRTKNLRKAVAQLIIKEKKTADAIWGGSLNAGEAKLLNPSLADFMAYGPARKKIASLLKGFQPGENQRSKTFAQALESAGLTTEVIKKAWPRWAVSLR